MGMSEHTVSIKDAAELLGVSRKHIYKLIERGQLHPVRRPVYREHGPVGIPLAEVEALIERSRTAGT